MRNRNGIKIKKCCASCAHKCQTRLMTRRRCTKLGRMVSPHDCCSQWQMADYLQNAGQVKILDNELHELHELNK